MKKLLLFITLAFLPIAAYAADSSLNQPKWSFELKGGDFTPTLSNWKEFYGRRSIPEYGVSLAYKVRRQIEVGVEAASISAKGLAYAPLHGNTSGSVSYDLYPVNGFILLRGITNENQWLVPYVGGGYTQMYYQEKVAGQSSARGSAVGYHYRAGLQVLLDALDPDAANGMYLDNGIYHTYLFIEAERISAIVKSVSVNLGGTAYMLGLLFEF